MGTSIRASIYTAVASFTISASITIIVTFAAATITDATTIISSATISLPASITIVASIAIAATATALAFASQFAAASVAVQSSISCHHQYIGQRLICGGEVSARPRQLDSNRQLPHCSPYGHGTWPATPPPDVDGHSCLSSNTAALFVGSSACALNSLVSLHGTGLRHP